MRTVRNVSNNPFYNQAFEEYVYETFRDDDVFLLWKNTPAVVVGSYQNICREVHVEALRQRGIPVVRRISGGGTIYTDMGGWQFTFIQHKEAGEIEFSQYIAPVIDALREMGVNAAFNGRNDLTIDGKKFSGNAQYRLGGCCTTARCCSTRILSRWWRPPRWTATRSPPRASSPSGTA